jgi:hypothetical protein
VAGESYSADKNVNVYVLSEQPDIEIVATIYHELRAHVFLSNMGRDPEKGSHLTPGVTTESKAAEAEAKKNFKDQ